MVITEIIIHARPEKRKEILQTIKGLSEQLTKTSGCVDVGLYQDIEDENVFYVMESWMNKHDLEKFKHSRLLTVLLGLKSLLVESPEINYLVEYTPTEKG